MQIAKAAHEKKLRDWEQPIYPYVAVCGPLNNLTKFYVVISNNDFACDSVLNAVERCYHCLRSLGEFPTISSHMWAFLERLVLHIKMKKSKLKGISKPEDAIEQKLNIDAQPLNDISQL